ncbi:PREDICTED: retinol dehydrogenase 13-like [Priapulus caudatus]|uniref:Retinol dehydrogenase 13-like n=1 Tax=Priapulus caudatus TaxID=37621 RepID=A0ABM1DVE2_PRICU|nr:PREDICTED: retinol dehydrogenase 13-like [Priapulus caudatus]
MQGPPGLGFDDIPSGVWKIAILIGVLVFIKVYFKGAVTYSHALAKGKTFILTGGNQGIGMELAKEIASRGGRIILACRNLESAKEAADEIKKAARNKEVYVKHLDLASLDSVHKFSEEIHKEEEKIDVLINNAGVMMNPELSKTKDGFEEQWQVNYLSHFLLTHLLLDLLKAADRGRIVNVSCRAHGAGEMMFNNLNGEQEYEPRRLYSQSKLAQVLFTRQMAKTLEGTNVTVNAAHPGVCNTNLLKHMPLHSNKFLMITTAPIVFMLMKSAKDGMNTPLTCAIADEISGVSGKYFSECMEAEPSKNALDDDVASRLWDVSMKMVGLGKGE